MLLLRGIMKQADPFYQTAAWKKMRTHILQRDHYMCVLCMKNFRDGIGGTPRAATLVHHIQPYKERPDLALDEGNLISLCEVCHNQVHTEKGMRRNAADTPAAVRIIKI